MKLRLVAEVLDEQLQDGKGVNAGRVDGLVLEVRSDGSARVAYVEVGPITLLARFSRRLASWYARYDARFGRERGRPYRIPWAHLERSAGGFRFRHPVESTPIDAVEQWLRHRIIERIPGS